MHSLVPTRVLIKKEGLYLISIKEYDSKARLCSCEDLAKRKVVFETVKFLYTVIQCTLSYIRDISKLHESGIFNATGAKLSEHKEL